MKLSRPQVDALIGVMVAPKSVRMGKPTMDVLTRHGLLNYKSLTLHQLVAGAHRYELTKKGFNLVDGMLGSLCKQDYSNAP